MGIEVKNLEIKYGDRIAIYDANLKIKDGEIATIIGPNGSGKSTLIKAISRYLKPSRGNIIFNHVDINLIPTKTIARKMAVLPQIRNISTDITVETLISYGRYPHIKFGKRVGKKDKEIIHWAMNKTGLLNLKDRYVSTLSGGERQRAWIAMALAQQPEVLILDEPTTYLDISYQLEVLELVKELNESLGITVVMVLHDINQAARYSDIIYVMMDGMIRAFGKPDNIIDEQLFEEVFGIEAHIYEDEVNCCPYFIPNKMI